MRQNVQTLKLWAVFLLILSGCGQDVFFAEDPIDRNDPVDRLRLPVIITKPDPMTATQGKLTVEGICKLKDEVSIDLPGQNDTLKTDCVDQKFAIEVTLKGNDGTKNVEASQVTPDGEKWADDRDFVKDTLPPNVKFVSPQPNKEVPLQVLIDGICENGLPVNIGGSGTSTARRMDCKDGKFQANVLLSNPDGLKSLTATQIDRAGNEGEDDRDFVLDSIPPQVEINTPSEMTAAQNGVSLSGNCESGLDVQISGPGLNFNTTIKCQFGSFTVPIVFSQSDGMKSVQATQTDPAGNRGEDSKNYIKDSTPPGLRITGPSAGKNTQGAIALQGTCESGINISLTGAIAQTGQSIPCLNGQFSTNIDLSGADGSKSVNVAQTDIAGNSTQDSRDFTKDTTAPVIQITGPNAGTLVQNFVDLTGTCETGLDVMVAGSGVAANQSTKCLGGQFKVKVPLSSGDGTKAVEVSQTDLAGNKGTDNRDFERDETAPNLAITNPDAGTRAQNGLTLIGICENGSPVKLGGIGLGSPAQTSCTNEKFNVDITFSAGDGDKLIEVSQTDSVGNTKKDSRSFVRDTTPPDIKIANPAAGTKAKDSITLSGICESGYDVTINGTGVGTTTTTSCMAGQFSALVNFSANDGIKSIQVSQTDDVGNKGNDSRDFERDSTAPNLQITGPAPLTSAQNGMTIVGNCEAGLDVSVEGTGVNAPTQLTCSSGTFSGPIIFSAGDGIKKVTVRQVDALGNSATDSRDFVKDTTAPIITINSPSNNSLVTSNVTIQGNCETGLGVQISGTGVNANVNANCTAGSYQADITLTTVDGTKEILASQIDGAGNQGQAQVSLVLDTTGPVIKIIQPAANSIHKDNLTLNGICESGLDVLVDGSGTASPANTPCSNGSFNVNVNLSSGDGPKDIKASQTDSIGNTASDSRTFIKDSIAPIVKIQSPPAGSKGQNGLTMTGICEDGLPVDLSGAGLGGPGVINCTGGQFNVDITFTNGQGPKEIQVSQTDSVGNTGTDSRIFQRDSLGPEIQITAPAINTMAQNGLTISGTCEDGLNVDLLGTGISAPKTISCSGGTFSTSINFSPGDGTKNIIAEQTDAVGNKGSDNRNFFKDTTAPIIAITAPAAMTPAQSQINLSGTCEDGINVEISGSGVQAPQIVNCNGSSFTATVDLSTGDGNKLIEVSQTDAVGNRGSDSRTFVRDTAAPILAIQAPAANSVHQISLNLTGVCEDGINVDIAGTGAASPLSTSCSGGNFSAIINLSPGDGVKNITASQTDTLGNVGTDSRNFIKDTTSPMVRITQPAPNTVVKDIVNIEGTCEDGFNVEVMGSGVSTPATLICSSGQFSGPVTLSPADGPKVIQASQTDGAGNVGTDSRTFVKDSQGPVIAIVNPAPDTVAKNGLTVTGTCEAGLPILMGGAGLDSPATATCPSGNFSVNVVFSSGDGPKVIQVSQTDSVGNTGMDSRTFINDTTPPAIQILQPVANTIAQTGLTLSGICEDGLNINMSGGGLASPSIATCSAGQFSLNITFTPVDGAKTITVSQTDAVGNMASDSRDFVRDTSGPSTFTISGVNGGADTTIDNWLSNPTPTVHWIVSSGAVSYDVEITDIAGSSTVCALSSTGGLSFTFSGCNLSDGTSYRANVWSKDNLGNPTPASNNGYVFTVDLSAPSNFIVEGATGGADTIRDAWLTDGNLVTANWQDTVGEDAYLVQILSATANVTVCSQVTTSANIGVYSFSSCPLFEGASYHIQVIAVDQAGNQTEASNSPFRFVLDTQAPSIAILNPAPNSLVQNSVTISGNCEIGIPVEVSGLGAQSPSTVNCSTGNFTANVNLSFGEGPKNIEVSQIDAAGNRGSDQRTFIKDTVAPLVQITSPAPSTVVVSQVNVVGTCENGIDVNLLGPGVNAPSSTPCNSGQFNTTVNLSSGDGNKTLIARQTDGAGNTGEDQRDFVRDSGPPVVKFTAPVAGAVASGNLQLNGTCEAGLPVDLSGSGLQSPSQTTCASGSFSVNIQFTAGDGSKLIQVAQTDSAGNTGTDQRSFVNDETAPIVKITAPVAGSPVGSSATISGTCESGLDITLDGSGVLGFANTLCTDGAFSVSVNFSFGGGSKEVRASQTDAAGNTGFDTRTFDRDTTTPIVKITTPVPNAIVLNQITLTGTCESGLNVLINGTGAQSSVTTPCSSSQFSAIVQLSNGDGVKRIVANQTDAAGNTGSDQRDFIRDTGAPIVTITSPVANTQASGGLLLEGDCESGLTVNLSGSGLQLPSTTNCAANRFSININFTNGDGSKLIQVSQTDVAGNTGSDQRTFINDETAPVVAITAPAALSLVGPTATVSGTCEVGLTVTLDGSGVNGSTSANCIGGSFSSNVTFTNGGGTKRVRASQTDIAGNTGSDSRDFTKDTSAPVVLITSPAANTSATTSLIVGGTCEDGLLVQIDGAGVQTPFTVNCSSSTFSANVTFSAGDGVKTVRASQTDIAGNTGSDQRNFLKDTSAPSIQITAPAANSLAGIGLTLSGSCEAGLSVQLSGIGLQSPSSTTCNGSFTVNITFTAGDGSKNIQVSQTDAAGNIGQDQRDFLSDQTAPVVQFTSPAPGTSSEDTITVQGICETGLSITFSGDLTAPLSSPCIGGTFMVDATFTSGFGLKTFTISQTDAVGNMGSDTRAFQNQVDPYDHTETFFQNNDNGPARVDILIVDDNSFSMELEQQEMGARFNSFVAGLGSLDWQIGITTTDCSSPNFNICGSLLELTGTAQKILTPSTTNADVLFADTVSRPETLDCLSKGICPSGIEEPLKASMSAMDKRSGDNSGFFRSDADLAVVVLSDEDERSDGPSDATKPDDVVNHFKSIWGTSKKLSVYGIIVEPGDSSCLSAQASQNGGALAFYGTHVFDLAGITGGVTGSICAPDYSVTLQDIGQNVNRLIDSVELSYLPDPSRTLVVFTPAQPSITWSISGNKIIFSGTPDPGTKIEVYYDDKP